MGASPTQLPPIVTPIVDTHTGLPTLPEYTWRQLLLQGRSAWTVYTPTTTHLTAITVNDCAFCNLGKQIVVRIGISGTSDGTAANITLPFKAKSQNQTFAAVDLTAGGAGEVVIAGDLLTLTVAKYDGTAPGNGTVHFWVITGVYEAQ